jgi:hypothetical protein
MGRSQKNISWGRARERDMAEAILGIPELIEQGSKFTFENFSSKSPRGYPSAYSDDWLVWAHRVTGIVAMMEQSPIRGSIAGGLGINLLGLGEGDFQSAANSILSGLRAAQKVFGETIPASDRTVTLGHNSPERAKALEKIDALVEAVKQANDLPGSPEEKEQLVAELSAGRRLLEASIIRLGALRATVQPALRWILEKAAGTIVGKIAGGVWDFLHRPALVVRAEQIAR